MTDLEMTKLCAQALEITPEDCVRYGHPLFDPLHDDAQAMALVKRFELWIGHSNNAGAKTFDWEVATMEDHEGVIHQDLNRAIVECVAKMQKTRAA